MPVNTNDLRDYADRISQPYSQLVLDAASELDALRTQRNLARAAAGAEPKPHSLYDSYYILPGDDFTGEMKIEAERHGVTTDLLNGLRRLVTGLHEGRPECGGDNGLRYLAGLLIDKERANIRRMLPYDPGG